MMSKRSFLAAFAALLLVPAWSAEQSPDGRAKAEKVVAALRTIEAEQGRGSAGQRSMAFTQAEFNAWLAYRLAEEGEQYVKSAEFKLLANNRVEGRIHLDLGKSPAGGLLSERQDLLFSAGFETREGRIKIDMETLYLGTQKLSPAIIDVIIGVVSRLQGVEPTSLRDWYDLPPGVRELRTQTGRVVVIY